MRNILSAPCPWCGEKLNLTPARPAWIPKRRRDVRSFLNYGHLYVGGLRPPASRCKVKAKFHAMTNAGQKSPIKSVSDVDEEKWIVRSIKKWESKSPYCTQPLLAKSEVRKRQRLAGKRQSREAKRLGGLNQSRFDKQTGGLHSAHVRWHKAKLVDGCKWCSVTPPAALLPPVTSSQACSLAI
jgi:hypothetical protein